MYLVIITTTKNDLILTATVGLVADAMDLIKKYNFANCKLVDVETDEILLSTKHGNIDYSIFTLS